MSEEIESGGLGDGMTASTPEPTQTNESTGLDLSSPETYKQFVETLPEDIRGYKAFAETENLQSLANQLVNAQSALGKKRLEAPQEDWTQDNWNDFYSQLRPENDEYSVADISDLELPEEYQDRTLPELPEEGIQELVDLAGQMGLTQQQFDVLYNNTVRNMLSGNLAEEGETADIVKQYKASLSSEWLDSFDANIKQSKDAFSAIAQDIPELNELVQDPTIANHPGMLKLFHKLATATGDTFPGMQNAVSTGFGENTSMNIQAQIRDIDSSNQELIMSNPAMLSPAERTKRDALLEKRTELYRKLYG